MQFSIGLLKSKDKKIIPIRVYIQHSKTAEAFNCLTAADKKIENASAE